MGAALLVTAWLGRQRARAVTSTLNRGQSMVLFESVRQQSRAMTEPPDRAQLDSLLRLHQAAGLRYLAFFDSSGAVIAQVRVGVDERGQRAEAGAVAAGLGAVGLHEDAVTDREVAHALTQHVQSDQQRHGAPLASVP